MQRFWPSHFALYKCRPSGLRPSTGHPRATIGRPRGLKTLFQNSLQLNNYFWGTILPSSTWSRDTLNMQRICLASLFEATSAFQIFAKSELKYFSALFDVVTGHRKYAVNRAGVPLLSSLFSLLSSRCVRPSRLKTRRGQNHFDCICAKDSDDAITIHL